MKRALTALALFLGTASLHAATDALNIGTVNAPAGTVSVPVYIRDNSTTRLGIDRPWGDRIQALAFKVTFSPANAVLGASFTRGGLLAKTPLFDKVVQPPAAGSSVGYVASFAESNNVLLFTSNAAAPGNLIGHLSVTTAPGLAAGTTIAIAIDRETVALSNQAATITETYANGGLSLQNGSIVISAGACTPFTAATISVVGQAGACSAGTGGQATVSVSGGGAGPTFQWGYRTTPGGAITPINGATGQSYVIAGADFGGTGERYLLATVSTNCAQIVASEFAVTISGTPNITLNASSAVYAGSTGNFASVADQGAGATYAWTVTNGTITAGQGTPSITYTAGPSGQVAIDAVVTATGCSGSSSPHADVPIIAQAAGASMLYLVTPCRILDTRVGPPLASGWEEEVAVSGVCGIPAGAKSIAANVTVVAPSSTGYLALYPSDGAWSGTSTLNYRPGRTRANNAVISLSANGHVTVFNAGTSVHYLIDVTGYFK